MTTKDDSYDENLTVDEGYGEMFWPGFGIGFFAGAGCITSILTLVYLITGGYQ